MLSHTDGQKVNGMGRYSVVVAFVGLWMFSVGCAQSSLNQKNAGSKSPSSIEITEILLEDSQAPYFNLKDRVFFTEAFETEDLPALKELDVQTIIYLVDDVEPAPEIIETVETEGMSFINLDYQWEGRRAKKLLGKIEKTFMAHHRNENVVVASSNLDAVRAWLAYHLRSTHKISLERALASSEKLGPYSSDQVREKVSALLSDR